MSANHVILGDQRSTRQRGADHPRAFVERLFAAILDKLQLYSSLFLRHAGRCRAPDRKIVCVSLERGSYGFHFRDFVSTISGTRWIKPLKSLQLQHSALTSLRGRVHLPRSLRGRGDVPRQGGFARSARPKPLGNCWPENSFPRSPASPNDRQLKFKSKCQYKIRTYKEQLRQPRTGGFPRNPAQSLVQRKDARRAKSARSTVARRSSTIRELLDKFTSTGGSCRLLRCSYLFSKI
jgi:hypothetical protein